MSVTEPEELISREEVVATMFTLVDIAVEVRRIRQVLEEDGEAEEDQ